jgi:hypothetical protein
MLEIKPVDIIYPVKKAVKINKDDHSANQEPPKKKPVQEGQEPQLPIEHIDEVV